MKAKRLLLGSMASVISILGTLALLEIGVRVYSASTASPAPRLPPLHVPVDSPVIYAPNPEHPEINSLAMRDDEIQVAKPEGTFRVLILGDSIAYGDGVARRLAFPDRLEALLRKTRPSAEVINSAVMGYTAYNELQYFLTRGKTFQADLVLVAFCLNDVANPRLHWDYTQERIGEVPPEAIPNHEYDRTHAIPLLRRRQEEEERKRRQFLRQHSRLYQLLERKVRLLRPGKPDGMPDVRAKVQTHITGEDTLSIEVLLDENSPESQWLRSMYDQLLSAVQHERSRLAIVLFPLAYRTCRRHC
jgi:lysophospholipase L1-like esterase